MPQSNKILQELKDLQSKLEAGTPGNIYSVPAGYFDDLVEQVIRRIKALEAGSAKGELDHLSPVLNSLSREMPYEVPQGYFESIDTTIHQSPEQELESISPFLGSLKKQVPYQVPQGYFETLGKDVRTEQKPAKVVALNSRKFFRYAAAAVIIGALAIGGLTIINWSNDPSRKSADELLVSVKKDVKKMSSTEISEFFVSSDPATVGNENVSVNAPEEIKELLKDVSDTEIKEFLEETNDLDTDPTMLN